MLKSILNSFGRAYGRRMGNSAARYTGWLVLPILVVVGIIVFIEVMGGGSNLTALIQPLTEPHNILRVFTR